MINNTKAFSLLLAGTVLSSDHGCRNPASSYFWTASNTETVAFLNNFRKR